MRRAAILPAAFTLALVLATPFLHAQKIAHPARRINPMRTATPPTLTESARINIQGAVALSGGVTTGGVNSFHCGYRRFSPALRTVPIDTRKPHARVEGMAVACICPVAVLISVEPIDPSSVDAIYQEIPRRAPRLSNDDRVESLKSWMAPPASGRDMKSERLASPWLKLVDNETHRRESRVIERKSDGKRYDTILSPMGMIVREVEVDDRAIENHLVRELPPEERLNADAGSSGLSVPEVQVISNDFLAEYGEILCCFCPRNGHASSPPITIAPPTEHMIEQQAEPAPAQATHPPEQPRLE